MTHMIKSPRLEYATLGFERITELPDPRHAEVGDIVLLDDGLWVLVPGSRRDRWKRAQSWRADGRGSTHG